MGCKIAIAQTKVLRVSLWRAELVVYRLQFTQKSTHFLNLNAFLSPNEP